MIAPGKEYTKAVLLSLRKEFVPAIFDGTKKAEYRKTFPQSFEGPVFVYECGPKSRHKVVGFFRTKCVAKIHPSLMASESARNRVLDAAEISGMPDEEFEELLTMTPDEPAVCIVPVLEPTLFKRPLSLDEFTDLAEAEPECRKPPMSWKETTVKTKFILPDTKEKRTMKPEQTDLFGKETEK